MMLLKGYKLRILRPECNPNFQSLHCIAELNEDIGEVIPYLNADLGAYQFTKDPPSVTFRVHGKLITVHPREIAVNALRDEEEARKIIEWMKGEINRVWENRDKIKPKYETPQKPNIIEILKHLPKTNCKKCKAPTCMVFAAQLAEGAKNVKDCPELSEDNARKLENYLKKFLFVREIT